MIRKIYSIRDSKAEMYHLPFFQSTEAEAVRSFTATTKDERTQLNKYPEDFDLYYLGTYDDNDGKMEILDTPQHITKAIHCVNNDSEETLKAVKGLKE